MSGDSRHPIDDELDHLFPDRLSSPVAAATIECLYRIAEAMESRYLGEILRDRHRQHSCQPELWD